MNKQISTPSPRKRKTTPTPPTKTPSEPDDISSSNPTTPIPSDNEEESTPRENTSSTAKKMVKNKPKHERETLATMMKRDFDYALKYFNADFKDCLKYDEKVHAYYPKVARNEDLVWAWHRIVDKDPRPAVRASDLFDLNKKCFALKPVKEPEKYKKWLTKFKAAPAYGQALIDVKSDKSHCLKLCINIDQRCAGINALMEIIGWPIRFTIPQVMNVKIRNGHERKIRYWVREKAPERMSSSGIEEIMRYQFDAREAKYYFIPAPNEMTVFTCSL